MATAKARSPSKGPVVIVTDSRGFGFQDEIDKLIKQDGTEISVQVFVWRRRGIASAVKETSKQLVWIAPSLIVVFEGIMRYHRP